MQIISLLFFIFATLVFFGIFICNSLVTQDSSKIRITKWILFISSYIFVIVGSISFAVVLAALTVIVWFCAKHRKITYLGIIASVGFLAYFKYTNFFIDSFAHLFGTDDFTAIKIILPLGISFYTFSAISYLVDVLQCKIKAHSFLDVAIYLSFFPKITSGPIQKSNDFFVELNRPRNIGWSSFSIGIQIFCFGLFKKLVLADNLSLFVNQVFNTPLAFSGFTVLLAVLSYTLQIYFDFSGYSDMAIGVARILDIHLPRNFNLPYISHNVTEFWKRWHITLSSWLQEYVYIPLGGSKKGKMRTYLNLLLTMIIGGIWHGPSWTYIFWGLLHGLGLVVHKLWMKFTKSTNRHHSVLFNAISITITFAFTSFCWIFFRADTLTHAFQILKQLSSWNIGIQHPYIWVFFSLIVLLTSTIVAFHNTKKKSLTPKHLNQSPIDAHYPIFNLGSFWGLVYFFVLCGLIIALAYVGGSPFIYGAY